MGGENVRVRSRGIGFSSICVSFLVTVTAFVVFGKHVELWGIYITFQVAERLPPQFRPGDADTVILGIKSGCTALAACIIYTVLLQLFSLTRRAGSPALRCQKCGQDLYGLVQLTCPKCRQAA